MTSHYLHILEIIIGAIISLGVLILGTGYSTAQFSKGKRQEKNDELKGKTTLTEYLTKQVEAYDLAFKERDKVIAALTTKVATFEAVMIEKDKTIARYLEILQNRNPDLEKTLSRIADFMESSKDLFSKVNTHLESFSGKEMKITGTVTSK